MGTNKPQRQIKDRLWKGGLDAFIEPAIHYFLADYAHVYDFSTPVVALDAELAKLYPDNTVEGRIADKLVRIKRKDGRYQWVVLHTEVQGKPDANFDKRMFQMFYRIYDRFDQEVVSLAILTDASESFRPGQFTLGRSGTTNHFQYNTFKLKDYKPHELLKGDNPFGFMLMAAWYHLFGGKTDQQKLDNKMTCQRLLFAAGLPKADTRKLMNFIMFYTQFDDKTFMRKLELNIQEEFQKEGKAMTIEEAVNWHLKEEGKAEGRLEGKAEGRLEGKAEGKTEGKEEVVLNAIKKGLDTAFIAELTGLTETSIEQLRANQKDLKK